jgi:transposase
MTRRVLSDSTWEQLQAVMRAKGCHRWPNDREIMEAILWKLRTGAPWRDLPEEFCPWQTAFNRFNRWAKKGLWADFFLIYEAKLIRSGYSSTEVTSALTNMQAELGVEKNEPSESPEEDLPPRFTWPPMRMEIRLILKSLGVKSTTPKRPTKSSKK